jgi:hypothetical protein
LDSLHPGFVAPPGLLENHETSSSKYWRYSYYKIPRLYPPLNWHRWEKTICRSFFLSFAWDFHIGFPYRVACLLDATSFYYLHKYPKCALSQKLTVFPSHQILAAIVLSLEFLWLMSNNSLQQPGNLVQLPKLPNPSAAVHRLA